MAATITTTVIQGTEGNRNSATRKQLWVDAFVAAGFDANKITEYSRTDDQVAAQASAGSQRAAYQTTGVNAIKGWVIEHEVAPGHTAFINIFRRVASTTAVGGQTPRTSTHTGDFVGVSIAEAWDFTTNRAISTNLGDEIGGWNHTYFTSYSDANQSTSGTVTHMDKPASQQQRWHGRHNTSRVQPLGHPLLGMAPTQPLTGGHVFYNESAVTTLISINHPEIRGVFVTQTGRFPQFVGYVRPANRPGWLASDKRYLFAATDSSFFSYRTYAGAISPDNSQQPDTDHHLVYPGMPFPKQSQQLSGVPMNGSHRGIGGSGNVSIRGDANMVSGKRDIIPAPHILYCTASATKGASLYGSFSADVAVTTADGLFFGDKVIVTPGVEEYMVISTDVWRNTIADSSTNNRYAQVPDSTYFPHVVVVRTV